MSPKHPKSASSVVDGIGIHQTNFMHTSRSFTLVNTSINPLVVRLSKRDKRYRNFVLSVNPCNL